MANVIKHKRGSGSDPVANDLVVGEVAIRTDTGKLFTKMDNGSVAEIAGGGSDIAINTLSSSSATGGGSATFNGSAYRFTLSSPPSVSAQQLLVSINGVIQKPVAGTGQPSEGFSVDGTDIILGDAPATGSDFFILTFKSLGVSEPADNSVTSAKIVDGAIVNADINASAAIAKSKLASLDIVNADVNTSAAIAGTKISPNFGSQNIDTNGNISGAVGTLTGLNMNGGTAQGANDATLFVTATNNNDWGIKIDKYNSSATEYGMRIDVGSSANFALQIRGNDSQVFNVAGNGAVTATSYTGDGSNLTGITAGAQGGGGESIFFESENEMNNSYTISTNHNALIAGPLTIASGATLTINSPSVVTIP